MAKSSAAWSGLVNTFGGNIYFADDGTMNFATRITSERNNHERKDSITIAIQPFILNIIINSSNLYAYYMNSTKKKVNMYIWL